MLTHWPSPRCCRGNPGGYPRKSSLQSLQHSPESESAAFTSSTIHESTACPETLNPSQRQRPRTGHSTAGLKDTGTAKPRCQRLPRRHRPPRRRPSAPHGIRPCGAALSSRACRAPLPRLSPGPALCSQRSPGSQPPPPP